MLSNVNGSSTTVTTAAASTSAGLGLTGLQVTAGGTTLTAAATIASGNKVTYTNGGTTTVFEFTAGSAALTTIPAAGTTVIGVQLGTTNSSSIGNLLTALQSNGVASSEDQNGVVTVTGGTSVTSTGLTAATTNSGVNAINAVNNAIATIGATLSKLGSATVQLQGLSSFSTQLSASVSTSLGAIVDANLSQESAKLSSLQTKQSLAIQSLSIANEGPSALLQLFR